MKAVMIADYGSNDVVQLTDIDRPIPKAGEVLVKVRAAGLNPIDWKIREGAGRRLGMSLPIVLGAEVAGTVEEVGEAVDDLKVGDAVFGITSIGSFAEYVAVPVEKLALKPVNLDFEIAAGVPLGALTSWQAMFDVAGLSEGQRVLITNGSGGVGSLAVQIAKMKGAHVTAMASGANEDYVRGLGADVFIDHETQSFEDAVSDMDVVYDTVGGDVFERAFKTLRKGGFMVTVVAFPQDQGQRFGVHVERSMCKANRDELDAIRALVESDRLKARIASVLPLDKIKEALDLSKTGRAGGKIVIRIAD